MHFSSRLLQHTSASFRSTFEPTRTRTRTPDPYLSICSPAPQSPSSHLQSLRSPPATVLPNLLFHYPFRHRQSAVLRHAILSSTSAASPPFNHQASPTRIPRTRRAYSRTPNPPVPVPRGFTSRRNRLLHALRRCPRTITERTSKCLVMKSGGDVRTERGQMGPIAALESVSCRLRWFRTSLCVVPSQNRSRPVLRPSLVEREFYR